MVGKQLISTQNYWKTVIKWSEMVTKRCETQRNSWKNNGKHSETVETLRNGHKMIRNWPEMMGNAMKWWETQ